MLQIFKLIERQFSKASMLAKLALIFNIALGYVVGILYNKTESLSEALISCHAKSREDLDDLFIRLNFLKHKIKEEGGPSVLNKEVDQIIKEQRLNQ